MVKIKTNQNPAPLIYGQPKKRAKEQTLYNKIAPFGNYLLSFASGTAINKCKRIAFSMFEEFSLAPRFPRSVYVYAQKLCEFGKIFDTYLKGETKFLLSAPIIEGLIFRIFLQEYALKKLPEKLLNRIAPQYSHLVDHKIAAAARIGLSALAFTLIHADPDGYTVQLVSSLATGIITGTIQELTSNPWLSMAFHSGGNLISAFQAGHEHLARTHEWICITPPDY